MPDHRCIRCRRFACVCHTGRLYKLAVDCGCNGRDKTCACRGTQLAYEILTVDEARSEGIDTRELEWIK